MQRQCRPDRRVAESKPQDEVAIEPLAGEKPDSPVAVARLVAAACRLDRTSSTGALPSWSSTSG